MISFIPGSNLSSYTASECCIDLIIAAWVLSMLVSIINAYSSVSTKIKNIIVIYRNKRKERAYRLKTSPDIEKNMPQTTDNAKKLEKMFEIE